MNLRNAMILVCGTSLTSLLLCANALAENPWNVPEDFPTIQAAIDSELVKDGDRIDVAKGEWAGATVTKAVEIKGQKGTVITSGPMPWSSRDYVAGFFFPGEGAGSGATIDGLSFQNVEFPIFSRGADQVTISNCFMWRPIQGISNWTGSGWHIHQNGINDLMTACGGGIGILVADSSGSEAGIKGNVVEHNKITGLLYVDPDDCGGYSGTGMALYADYRWDSAGATEISGNTLTYNRVTMYSDTPTIVDITGIELSMAGLEDPIETLVIFDNAITYNDLRCTEFAFNLYPTELYYVNTFSKNKPEAEEPARVMERKPAKIPATARTRVVALY